MSEQIRAAAPTDVAAMTTLASIRREEYARYQPLFWQPAVGAQDKHRSHLASLVTSSEVITLVSEEAGQLTGVPYRDPDLRAAGLRPGAAPPASSMTSQLPRQPNG